jgi:hypothetical protein
VKFICFSLKESGVTAEHRINKGIRIRRSLINMSENERAKVVEKMLNNATIFLFCNTGIPDQ